MNRDFLLMILTAAVAVGAVLLIVLRLIVNKNAKTRL